MLKQCANCKNNISFQEFYISGLINGFTKCTCSKCGIKYTVKKQFIFIYLFIALIPLVVLIQQNKSGIIIIWILISILIIQPLIFWFGVIPQQKIK